MCYSASSWAWKQHGLPPLEKLALLALAERQNKQTGKCFPSMQTIADDTGMSRRTAIRAINMLIEKEVITAIKTLGKPTYYTVPTGDRVTPVDQCQSVTSDRVTPLLVTECHRTGDRVTPEPITNLEVNQELKDIDHSFDEFWKGWPKKTGKAAAEKAWKKIKDKPATLALINQNLEMRANAGQWQNPQFIPNPATYLNGKRWEDEIYQEQNNGQRNQHKNAGSIRETATCDF